MSDYHIIITDAGAALETAAHAAGKPLVLTAFGVCDGGTEFTPDPTLTVLGNEVYHGAISSLTVSADDPATLVAQCIIPASSGGYTIRGIGIYTEDGTLYAVGNYPDQLKPSPDSGYAASLEILALLSVSDVADVTLKITEGAGLTKPAADQLYVPLTRQINGYAMTDDLELDADDVGAVPRKRQINGYSLASDVELGSGDVGALSLKGGTVSGDVTVEGVLSIQGRGEDYPVYMKGLNHDRTTLFYIGKNDGTESRNVRFFSSAGDNKIELGESGEITLAPGSGSAVKVPNAQLVPGDYGNFDERYVLKNPDAAFSDLTGSFPACTAAAEVKKEALLSEASKVIMHLQDRIDTGMEAESETLIKWKKYRIALYLLDVSAAPDIDWPDPPLLIAENPAEQN